MWFPSILAAFILLNSVNNAKTKYLQNASDTDKYIYDKYIELDKDVKNFVNYGVKMALPYIMEANEHVNMSSSCANNLFVLMSGIKTLKLSAVKFLDASGKIPPGVITGTLSMLGDYDECLNSEVLRGNGNIAFRGQYCMIDIKPILPKTKGKLTVQDGFEELLEYAKNTSEVIQFLLSKLQHTHIKPIKYGLCIPSGCTKEDVTLMLNYLGEKAFTKARVEYCDPQGELQMRPGMIAAISFFSVAALLVIVGTSMDHYSRKKGVSFERKTAKILMCFSVSTNFPKVMSTKTVDSALTSIFGIRTLSLFFIILMHQYYFWGIVPIHGHNDVFENKIPDFFFQIVFNGFLATEVFFFLGGILNTYTRMKIQKSGKHQPTILQTLIHRLWR